MLKTTSVTRSHQIAGDGQFSLGYEGTWIGCGRDMGGGFVDGHHAFFLTPRFTTRGYFARNV